MNEKTKLIVFAKKEVFLLLAFFVLSIFISFTFGFRLGKDYSFLTSPLSEQDKRSVDDAAQMKAVEEENVEKQQLEAQQNTIPQEEVGNTVTKDTNDMMVKRLQEELNQTDAPADAAMEEDDFEGVDENVETVSRDELGGKYTIQVGSFRSLLEAEEFAKGFQVRGYNPIIEKADLKEKGVRFRVSLGAFDNVAEAREYISKEKTLFLSQDYHIRPIE